MFWLLFVVVFYIIAREVIKTFLPLQIFAEKKFYLIMRPDLFQFANKSSESEAHCDATDKRVS